MEEKQLYTYFQWQTSEISEKRESLKEKLNLFR